VKCLRGWFQLCECAEEPPDSGRVWQAAEGSKEGAAKENAEATQEATCCLT